jgi:hypothetical protein
LGDLVNRALEGALSLLLEQDDGRNRGGSNPGKEDGEQGRAAEHGDRPQIGANVIVGL